MMPPKPHRVLLDRVSGYADEAAAYMRRRRVSRRPFARLYYAGGRSRRPRRRLVAGGELFVAAGSLIEVAGRRSDEPPCGELLGHMTNKPPRRGNDDRG